jgi:hypothetical protein
MPQIKQLFWQEAVIVTTPMARLIIGVRTVTFGLRLLPEAMHGDVT